MFVYWGLSGLITFTDYIPDVKLILRVLILYSYQKYIWYGKETNIAKILIHDYPHDLCDLLFFVWASIAKE